MENKEVDLKNIQKPFAAGQRLRFTENEISNQDWERKMRSAQERMKVSSYFDLHLWSFKIHISFLVNDMQTNLPLPFKSGQIGSACR